MQLGDRGLDVACLQPTCTDMEIVPPPPPGDSDVLASDEFQWNLTIM